MNKTVKILAYILITLAIIVLVVPFLIPVGPAPDTLPLEELVDPGSQYIDAGGVKIYYRQSGVNEPVFILLHGFGASTFSWREVFDDFAGLGSVIAYDRPAFGYTERPLPGEWGDENPYSNEAQVDQLWALMDTLGIQKAILVGHSAGGSIAVQAALEHPERVESLILVDPAIYSNMSAPAWLRRMLKLRQADRLGPLLVRQSFRQAGRMLENAWHNPLLITPEIERGYFRPFKADQWDLALWELVKARGNPQISARVGELSMPVLVVTGDDDKVIPIWESQRLAKAIPNARLVVIENCGHMPQEERPEEFMSAIDAFLVK